MGASTRRGRWWSAGLVLGCAAVAVAAPMVTSGPFSLPDGGALPSPLWTGPAPRRVAARVRVKTGQVEVQAKDDAQATAPFQPLRTLATDGDLLLEGRWTDVQVALAKDAGGNPTGFPASGIYEVRELEPMHRDRFVGEADVEVAANAWGPAYLTSVPGPRLVTARSAGADVWVRADHATSSVQRTTRIDADDATFVAVGAGAAADGVTGVSLMGDGAAGRASVAVFDAAPPASLSDGGSVVLDSIAVPPPSGGFDYDFALVDGSVQLRVTYVNHCSGTLWVLTRVPGQPGWQTEAVEAGRSMTFEGRFAELQWCHSTPGRVTVSATVVP